MLGALFEKPKGSNQKCDQVSILCTTMLQLINNYESK